MKDEQNALQIDKFYDGLSASWDKTRPKFTTEVFARIHSKINSKDASILDFGCGTGLLTKYLHEKLPGAKIDGMDISQEMIKKAQANCPECRFYYGDISSAELPQYDVIIAKDVFNHIPDFTETIVKLDERLKPKGSIIIANREREQGKKRDIFGVLESLGFSVSAEEYTFNPSSEEINAFLSTLSGFSETHKAAIKKYLESSGKYYIIYSQKT